MLQDMRAWKGSSGKRIPSCQTMQSSQKFLQKVLGPHIQLVFIQNRRFVVQEAQNTFAYLQHALLHAKLSDENTVVALGVDPGLE